MRNRYSVLLKVRKDWRMDLMIRLMENKMTRRGWMKASLAALTSLAAANNIPVWADIKSLKAVNVSKVYMTKEISPESLVHIYEAVGRPAMGRVAVKISTGEPETGIAALREKSGQ